MNTLFTDGVASIFAFLDNSSWLQCGRSSRGWFMIAHSSRHRLCSLSVAAPSFPDQFSQYGDNLSLPYTPAQGNPWTRLDAYMVRLIREQQPHPHLSSVLEISIGDHHHSPSSKSIGPPISYALLQAPPHSLYFSHMTSIQLPLELPIVYPRPPPSALRPGQFVRLMSCIPTLRSLQCALKASPQEGSQWYFEKYERLKCLPTLTSLTLQCVQEMMPTDPAWLVDSLCAQIQLTQLHLSYFPRGDRNLSGFVMKLKNLRDFSFSQKTYCYCEDDLPPSTLMNRIDHDQMLLPYFLLMIQAATERANEPGHGECCLESMSLWKWANKLWQKYDTLLVLKTILEGEKHRYAQWYRALLIDPTIKIQGAGPSTEIPAELMHEWVPSSPTLPAYAPTSPKYSPTSPPG